MTAHPNDLAALRALVEAVQIVLTAADRLDPNGVTWPALRTAVTPATAALARLEESAKSFRDRWCSLCEGPGLIGADGEWYCPLCLIVEQHGKLARLEGLTEEALAATMFRAFCQYHGWTAETDGSRSDLHKVLVAMARAALALLRGEKADG